jgi:hypothetical protein
MRRFLPLLRITAPFSVALAVLGIVTSAAPAAAASTSTADKRAILSAICEKGQIRKGACRRARGYPEGRRCDIGLTGEGGEGRFLGDEAVYLVAGYTSGCEPHANNWGGALIFSRGAGGKLTFLGYQPGMAVTDCLVMARSGGGERLVCQAGWMGQGYASEIIGEVVLTQGTEGLVAADLQPLLSAGRSEDAVGVNAVECDKPVTFFSFKEVTPGSAPETIAVQADYADAPLIKSLCAKPGRNATLGFAPPQDNEAYIAKQQEMKGRFVYDLAKRELLPTDAASR